MRFLRTASTARLLAVIASALVAVCAGAAIAVAAVGSGPVPPPRPLAQAVHGALTGAAARPVRGVSANITFTDNLIDSSDFTGQASDPLLQGASGRLWASGGRLRIELQSGDGDAQIVVDGSRLWISDPSQNVVYEGTLPASHGSANASTRMADQVPSLARIESVITRLTGAIGLSGALPTDVGGQPAYRITMSPKPASGGLLGSLSLAFDATRGVPLSFDVYARGDTQPVLGLSATQVSYGSVPASVFQIAPPAGSRVVPLGTLTPPMPGDGSADHAPDHGAGAVTGTRAVAAQLPFGLRAPSTVAGLQRSTVRLVGHDGALVDYGHGLGGIAVLETAAHGHEAATPSSAGGLSLPTRRIGGATATVLSTPLGTVLTLRRDGVAYTVLGSVTESTAQSAAAGLF